jgi:DNA-binding CsgD family transcriptional regulator
MERFDAADLARVGRFVAEAGEIVGDEPFPPTFLAALQRLVPCDWVGFNELDRVRERHLDYVEYPLHASDAVQAPITYWQARPDHPLCRFHESTGDWRAYRLSDFVTMQELRRRAIYEDWVRPSGQTHLITVGLDGPLEHTKVFLFHRPDGPDFDERDCLVLDVLRPYFAVRYAAHDRQVTLDDGGACVALTPRERQILALVAEGKTNGHIAAELYIATGTVRRHLENAYAKLGVHTRTAAVRAAAALGSVLAAALGAA